MKKILTILLLIFVSAGFGLWYSEFLGYEKFSQKRIETYMEAQGITKDMIVDRRSIKDWTTGRWEIDYKLKDEEHLRYEYSFDKKRNEILLIVFEDPGMMGGRGIDDGMAFPPLEEDGWSGFNSKGELILNER